MNIRMLPPAGGPFQSMSANGRPYASTPGNAIDVPDFDAGILEANGWTRVCPSGPTSARPSGTVGMYAAIQGAKFYDTTVAKLIEFDGTTWRDPSGSVV